MPRQPRLDLADIPQHIVQRGNDRQPCFFTDAVRYINDHYLRTGTLWEGRYKSSLVDRETYLLHCYRYIELNPLRARMTADPADYAWSSHACNAFGRDDPLIKPHPTYMALGNTDLERQGAYRTLAMDNLSQDHLDAIRAHLQRQHALGSDRFRIAIEKQLSRRAGPAKIGRPRKIRQDKPPESALCPLFSTEI